MNALRLLAIALAVTAASPAQRVTGQRFDKLSPFRAMRESPAGLEVQVEDATWYALVKLDGIDSAKLIRECKRLTGDRWWKRITEDLVEVLHAMGHEVDREVDLELRDLATGKVVTLEKVAMTNDNRQRLWAANKGRDDDDDHKRRAVPLPAAACRADLEQLVQLLDQRFAYRHRLDVDLDGLVAAALERMGNGAVSPGTLIAEVDAILRAFGDGHSRLAQRPARWPGFLPCLIEKVEGGYVAFDPGRRKLVDAKNPFVVAIDGVPLERWLEASRKRATRGSPQLIERDAVRGLRLLNDLRAELGVEADDDVKLTLRGATSQVTRKLDVSSRWPIYGTWPQGEHRRIDDIGYLRIPQMTGSNEFLDGLDTAMHDFRDTLGLIIDVRGNGGGSRAILQRLFPYFLAESDPPRVANIAAYRLPNGEGDPMHRDGYLQNRSLYPATWDGWSAAQKRAIVAQTRGFKPEWTLPDGFSAWHYFVLSRDDNSKAYHYDRPVIVLLDGGCFSATDIFLGAFKGHRDVTLLGTPSGGGSGRSQGYRLRNSRLQVRLSSMASFRPTGELYEGRGVAPDVLVEPRAADVIRGADSVLDNALDRLR